MPEPSTQTEAKLRILHVFRTPVGGLFRHVVDLAGEQIHRGHAVGLVVDSSTGGEAAERVLAEIAPGLALGLTRFPMRRDPHPADAIGLIRVARRVAALKPDVIHGHGSKGALYARLTGLLPLQPPGLTRVYTPHGGSLHFDPRSLKGRLIYAAERLLANRSDLILFESAYAAGRYASVVGATIGLTRIVHNGIAPGEFESVVEREDAAEFLYVGELRLLKGVDVFLKALAGLHSETGRAARAVLVGSGPDRALLEALATSLGLADRVRFAGPLPARQAFALGRILVVPSRAESLPYVVLEAAGAGRPLIATRVGGIPEIMGPFGEGLVPPDDVEALAGAMDGMLAASTDQRSRAAADLSRHVQSGFSIARMVEGVMGGYREAMLRRRHRVHPVRPAPLLTQRSGS